MMYIRKVTTFVWGGFLPYVHQADEVADEEFMAVQMFKWRVGLVGTLIGAGLMAFAKLMGA